MPTSRRGLTRERLEKISQNDDYREKIPSNIKEGKRMLVSDSKYDERR